MQHCVRPPELFEALDLREPFLKEVQKVVRKARARSAPGPSGTRSTSTVPSCYTANDLHSKSVVFCGYPKEDSKTVSQFRLIVLLSVEGKIFFSNCCQVPCGFPSEKQIH